MKVNAVIGKNYWAAKTFRTILLPGEIGGLTDTECLCSSSDVEILANPLRDFKRIKVIAPWSDCPSGVAAQCPTWGF